jgi:hypothetical protein
MNAATFQLSPKQFFFWGVLFALIQAVCIASEWYFIALLPFIVIAIWLAIYKIEWIWFFTVLSTPLSINLESLEIAPIGMYLPTEPIIAALLVLMIYKILSRQSIDKKIYKHPFTKLLGLYLLWMIFTAVTSEFPVVSFKFIATRLWFISGFYLIGTQLFQNPKNINRFFGFYLAPFMVVIGYTVFRHAQFLFDGTFFQRSHFLWCRTCHVLPCGDWSTVLIKEKCVTYFSILPRLFSDYNWSGFILYACRMD